MTMTEFSEEVSAYTTPEIKKKFKSEAKDEHGKQGQSAMLRQILRDRYANQEAEDVADELRVESRLEDVTARLMDDMADHREEIDGDVSLAAIYSVAQFEAMKIAGDLKDSQAWDAIRKAKNRVHTDAGTPEDAGESRGSSGDNASANTPVSETEGASGSMPEQTQSGFDLSWRDKDEAGE